jgi:hypothetical protein
VGPNELLFPHLAGSFPRCLGGMRLPWNSASPLTTSSASPRAETPNSTQKIAHFSKGYHQKPPSCCLFGVLPVWICFDVAHEKWTHSRPSAYPAALLLRCLTGSLLAWLLTSLLHLQGSLLNDLGQGSPILKTSKGIGSDWKEGPMQNNLSSMGFDSWDMLKGQQRSRTIRYYKIL